MNSFMLQETQQIAGCVQRALDSELPEIPPVPEHLYTLARGSSDHAATVTHRFMAMAGLPATTMPPSLILQPLRLTHATLLGISQSGASPDLYTAADRCRQQGCPVVALVNVTASPLAEAASIVLAQHAGDERAVAATKSVVCSIVMGARLAERWGAPSFGLSALPEQIHIAQKQPIDELVKLFAADGPLLVIGRGTGLGVAAEIALKVQELLGRPAMAYSSAEVLHGPAGMIVTGYPVLALAVGTEQGSVMATVKQLGEAGADVMVLSDVARADAMASIVLLAHVYLALEAACRQRGRSPDKPENLSKVTLTQ